jgi:hypothetical protein
MTDVLFLSKGRPEFTRASWAALQKNTPNATFWVFTDGDESQGLTGCEIIEPFGGPVACMNACLDLIAASGRTPQYLAKVDNDLVLCEGWLRVCERVVDDHPELDCLGIEPWTPDAALFPAWVDPMVASLAGYEVAERSYRKTTHIGGIGLFRISAFERFGRPTPNAKDGRYGLTEWMWQHPDMIKGFLNPPLPVFLLDHLPSPYWMYLSKRYEDAGTARRVWGFYHPVRQSKLWEWWYG